MVAMPSVKVSIEHQFSLASIVCSRQKRKGHTNIIHSTNLNQSNQSHFLLLFRPAYNYMEIFSMYILVDM